MNRSTIRRLLGFAKPYWRYFVIGILGALSVSAVDAFFARMIKPIVDHGLGLQHLSFALSLAGTLLLLFVIRGVASFISTYFINRIARTVVMILRRKLFKHLQSLPLGFYKQYGQSSLLSLMLYNVEQIALSASQIIANAIQDIALILGLLLVMFTVCWPLALLFIIIAPFILWVAKRASVRSRRLNLAVQKTMSRVTNALSEMLRGVRETRVYGAENKERERFFSETRANQMQTLKVVVTKALSGSIIQLLVALPIVLALCLSSLNWFSMTAGSFASVLTAMVMIIRPMKRLSQANTDIQQGLAGAETVFAVLDTPEEDRSGRAMDQAVVGHVQCQNLSYTYPDQAEPVLKEVSFEAAAGSMTALVGPSGGGKTTLVHLLMRFYEPDSGCISLDSALVNELSLTEYWQQFSLVTQSPALFNDTIAYNVAYGDDSIDENKVELSLQAAQLWQKVSHMSEGTHTVIGEEGASLSGGEKQRLALARALYKGSPLVVLDEATSALDTPTERLVQKAIDALREKSTLFVIAHRLSTVKQADQILVLDDGRIVDSGSHDQLLKTSRMYRSLCQNELESI